MKNILPTYSWLDNEETQIARKVFEANITACAELTKYSNHPQDAQQNLRRYNEGTDRPLADYLDAYTELRWRAFKFGWDSGRRNCVDKEKLAEFIFKHGFSTGHGDTVDDLLEEFDWQMTDQNKRLATWKRISEIIRTAENSMNYSGKHVIFNGIDVGTVGNLLVEMTPLPALERTNVG